MEYILKIDKYVKDRFKIFKGEKDKPLYIGEKIGNAASYFDAFIGETYSKGANFVFFDLDINEVLKIERNFYDISKEYKIYSNREQIGLVKSALDDPYIEININFKGEDFHIYFNVSDYILKVDDIGEIQSIKQGFKNYEEISIKIDDEKYEMLLITLAVYIWDVFMKNKVAFIKKK